MLRSAATTPSAVPTPTSHTPASVQSNPIGIAYQDGDRIYVVEVATGETREVAAGRMAAWFDDDTLIVAPNKP